MSRTGGMLAFLWQFLFDRCGDCRRGAGLAFVHVCSGLLCCSPPTGGVAKQSHPYHPSVPSGCARHPAARRGLFFLFKARRERRRVKHKGRCLMFCIFFLARCHCYRFGYKWPTGGWSQYVVHAHAAPWTQNHAATRTLAQALCSLEGSHSQITRLQNSSQGCECHNTKTSRNTGTQEHRTHKSVTHKVVTHKSVTHKSVTRKSVSCCDSQGCDSQGCDSHFCDSQVCDSQVCELL